jgi:hypothetical protein
LIPHPNLEDTGPLPELYNKAQQRNLLFPFMNKINKSKELREFIKLEIDSVSRKGPCCHQQHSTLFMIQSLRPASRIIDRSRQEVFFQYQEANVAGQLAGPDTPAHQEKNSENSGQA